MIQQKNNVIIFHGHNSDPEDHWFPWLQAELEKLKLGVFVPKLPKDTDQTPEKFAEFFETIKDKINKDTILIGHSLGGSMIMHALAHIDTPVAGSIFVGSFGKSFNDENEDAQKCAEFVKNIAWKKVRKNAGNIKIIASTNDPFIPVDVSVHLGTMLQEPVHFYDGAGHFMESNGYEKFPKLLDYIKSQIYLTYDEFKKLDARVGHIMKVEEVEDADKLLRFEIDFGGGELRQIVSGIREFYPEPSEDEPGYKQLVGKQLLYVTNLEPREIKGITSYGMLMAVDGSDGNPVFLVPEKPVDAGSSVR